MVQGGVPAAAPAGGAAGGSTSGGKQASELATASQTITGLATGTHVYTVKGHSLLLGRGVGESVSSEQFQAGGHSWVVQFYPGKSEGQHHKRARERVPAPAHLAPVRLRACAPVRPHLQAHARHGTA